MPHSLHSQVQEAARLLPAQGPITVFVHHNTLHAFEDRPFLDAVVEAGELLGCEPFLSEDDYRTELGHGRILEEDLRAALIEDGCNPASNLFGAVSHLDLRLAMLEHPFHEEDGPQLAFLLERSHPFEHLLSDAPPSTRWALTAFGHAQVGIENDTEALAAGLRALWHSCLALAKRSASIPPMRVPARPHPRRRGDLVDAGGPDIDEELRPLLTRWCASFLDQSIALWQMPGRENGMYAACRALYSTGGLLGAPWTRGLAKELARQQRADLGASDVVLMQLEELGVPLEERQDYLTAELLALRGWAGIIHQLELRPDRLGDSGVPVSLIDYLALRLTLSALCLGHYMPKGTSVSDLTSESRERRQKTPAPVPSLDAITFRLFQTCERLGLTPPELDDLDAAASTRLVHEVLSFDELTRRRVFHLAYERRHAEAALAAIASNASHESAAKPPAFQAVFCIDEREESLRRHLEELAPDCATLGALGYFGVAMYFQGAGAAHSVALCPVSIRPEHEVHEVVEEQHLAQHASRAARRRQLGRLAGGLSTGSKTAFRGTLLTAAFGILTTAPLILRIAAPRLAARLRQRLGRAISTPRSTRLALDATGEPGHLPGTRQGFTTPEMAAIVRTQLEELGLENKLAPLVLIVGHGSASLNNPQESAHDCGACGGSRGGPNARAFAAMANDPRVRDILAADGFNIPETTQFVGLYHDTCDDSVRVFDLPKETRSPLVNHALGMFEQALGRNAQERCRHFPNTSLHMTPHEAHRHVEGRAEDLAQPRPEFGHASNALCVVGRRELTRGLFMDRRAFLSTYDPATDDEEGTLLERVLEGAVPVGAGINLEYYFSFVDPEGYGCGTKLPHNITAMLGVMNGHMSDLRTGLPWQMVEIHEPVRLLCIVEAQPEVVKRVLARNAGLRRLIENGWVRVRLFSELAPGPPLPTAHSSRAWFEGHRTALAFARIGNNEAQQ